MEGKRVSFTKTKTVLWFSCLSVVLLVLLGVYDYYNIQNVREKVGKAASEEYLLLIAVKSLNSAGEGGVTAIHGYLSNNGSESYKDQYLKQAALTEYNMNIVKKHHPSKSLTTLLQKHEAYLEYVENEVLAVYDSGDIALAKQHLEKSHAALQDIQTGYEKLITTKEYVIKKIEQEVELADSISKVVLSFMSFFLVVSSAAVIFFIFQKNKTVDSVYDHKEELVVWVKWWSHFS